MSDTTIMKNLDKGRFATQADFTDSGAEVKKRYRRVVVAPGLVAAEAMASDVSDVPLFRTVRACRVIEARIIPRATSAANDTDYITVSVKYDDDAGGSDTSVASQTTKTTGGGGAITSGQSWAMTVADDAYVAAGKMLHLITAKGGAGKILGICAVELDVEEE